jgi:hypothetical protein
MATSLEDFVEEMKGDIDKFADAWRKKNAENPEYYPMSFGKDNDGMWFESFMTFCQSSEA